MKGDVHRDNQTIDEYYPTDHPKCSAESTFLVGWTNSELYSETMGRLTLIASKGFRAYYVWHYEYQARQKNPFATMTDCLRRSNA
jgi:hypothetical protein